MLCKNDCLDIATHREIRNHTHPARLKQSDQIVEDNIRRRLVTDLPIPVLIDIELQTLQFNYILIGHIVNRNSSKIGKARSWTKASKLWGLQVHNIISPGMSIGPSFQLARLYLVYSISTRSAVLFVHCVSSPNSYFLMNTSIEVLMS